MPVTSVGDRAQQFISLRTGGNIKTELGQLAESLSTGKVTDVTKHLDGETARFSGITYTLKQLDGYSQTASETKQMLSAMQTVLAKVDNTRSETSSQLLLLTQDSTLSQVDEAGRAARSAFDNMVLALNTQFADRALMGGTDVSGPPLADADAMMADLIASIGAATTQADIETAIEFWFDDPAGGFATMGYLGDTGAILEKRITDTKTYPVDARADDPAIRDVLKSAAFAAVANDLSTISSETKGALLRDAGQRMFVSADRLIGVQSRIGFVEAAVDQTAAEVAGQRTSLEIAQNNLISADPFETASRLQSVQLQLETHYSVTGRLSQLSLLGYI